MSTDKQPAESIPPPLGQVEADYIGELLKTGYSRFSAPTGIDGLVRWHSLNKVEFLVLLAANPGTGQFRNFVQACKKCWDEILIWEVWNADLVPVLLRYGFEPTVEVENGERLEGYRWRKSDGERAGTVT